MQLNHSAFVTYGWCRTAYIATIALARQGIKVHVGDASPLAMSRFSKYTSTFTKLPDFFLEPDNYFEQVLAALSKTKSQVLLPCHEDVGIFCERKEFLPKNIYVSLPDPNSYNIASDKKYILDYASKIGCPTPNTLNVTRNTDVDNLFHQLGSPIVIKTHFGNSAKGVRIVHTSDEFRHAFDNLITTYNIPENNWPFAQEYLSGRAIGVCMLYHQGECQLVYSERYIRCKEPGLFGTSTFRESFYHEETIHNAKIVMDDLKWHGVAHLDFIEDAKGQFKLIEINPRLWGALALSYYSGVDFVYHWYLSAIEQLKGVNCPIILNNKCRWILGECLAGLEYCKRRQFISAAKLLWPINNCHHDDFSWRDPLPFIFEFIDYGTKFIRSGGKPNPVKGNMIH